MTSPPSQAKSPSILKAAGLIAFVTILSKVLGAVRDWQIMNVYGASLASDAYFAAVQIPSFAMVLLGGLGGPFHTATVAVFSKLLRDEGPPSAQAKQLAGSLITLTALVFMVLSVLIFFQAEFLMRVILQEASPALIENASQQLRLMSPVFFLGGMIGIFYGILNLYHVYFWPSLSPAALSLVMSLALLLFPNDPSGHLLAWSTLLGSILQFLVQLPDFWKRGFSLRPTWGGFTQPEIRQVGEILFPAIIGTTIGQLTTYVDMFFTATLPIGGWTAVTLGNRLIQLPIGVLQTALLVPIFPRFTRYVVDENWTALKQDFNRGVVSLWLISIPILVWILFYTEPIIRLVFQHGQFDAQDTRMVTDALVFLAFSMLPYFARDSLTRVFYAFHDSRTPLMVGMIAIGLKAFLDWLWVVHFSFGVGGITLSTTMITVLNMTLLAVLSKRHLQDLGFRGIMVPFLKLCLAGVGMAGVMFAVQTFSGLGEWGTILLSSLGGFMTYGLLALQVKIPEVLYLKDRLRGYFSR